MLLRVDFKSGKPAYLQVMEQIKAAAASGTLRPGEALPSIGSLAGELRVNRNAIAKAYSELEGLGVIEVQPGGGYFLKENRQRLRKEARPIPHVAEIDPRLVRAPFLFCKVLTYSLLAVLLGALYLALGVHGQVGAAVAAAAVAIAVFPLWRGIDRLVHHVVFAKRFQLPRLLRILKAEAPLQPNLDSFMQRVAERTEALLGTRPELIRDRAQVMSLMRSFPALQSAGAPVFAGADLLMPVVSDVEVHGVLRLAPKSTGEEYDAEDWKFLAAVAEQVAVTANQFRLRQERQESEYALDIQHGLLPREIPQIMGFSIAVSWQPAKTVGGDYSDVFQLTDTELALIIADVSGKGMAAALLMSNLQATVKAYATLESSPKELCARVNGAMCRSITPGKFITFFYAVLDATACRLTYTNAGHAPPLLVRHDGTCQRLRSGGAVLGVFADQCYESATADLRAGDRLLLFTDGITEAADSNGEEFGEERLVALVGDNPGTTAAELQDMIMQRVTQFCGEDFADDATLLAVVVDAPPQVLHAPASQLAV